MLKASEARAIAQENAPRVDQDTLARVLSQIEAAARNEGVCHITLPNYRMNVNVKSQLHKLGYSISASSYEDTVTIYWEDAHWEEA